MENRPKPGWSWGAMMFGWMWGIGNHCYIPLLGLVPVLNLFWWAVCGYFGHEWAYNSGCFNSLEEYRAVQDSWDRAGKVSFFILLALVLAYVLFVGSIVGLAFSAFN